MIQTWRRRFESALLCTIGLTFCGCHVGSWENRFEGETFNIQGFGETASDYGTTLSSKLPSSEESDQAMRSATICFEAITNSRTKDGKSAVILRFNLGALVVIGTPSTNPYWYLSDDAAVNLWLVRQNGLKTDLESRVNELLAAPADGRVESMGTYQLRGEIAMEPPSSKSGHFDTISINVQTVGPVTPNGAWMRAWEHEHLNNDAVVLRIKRWNAVPAQSWPATIVGAIYGEYIFHGW